MEEFKAPESIKSLLRAKRSGAVSSQDAPKAPPALPVVSGSQASIVREKKKTVACKDPAVVAAMFPRGALDKKRAPNPKNR